MRPRLPGAPYVEAKGGWLDRKPANPGHNPTNPGRDQPIWLASEAGVVWFAGSIGWPSDPGGMVDHATLLAEFAGGLKSSLRARANHDRAVDAWLADSAGLVRLRPHSAQFRRRRACLESPVQKWSR